MNNVFSNIERLPLGFLQDSHQAAFMLKHEILILACWPQLGRNCRSQVIHDWKVYACILNTLVWARYKDEVQLDYLNTQWPPCSRIHALTLQWICNFYLHCLCTRNWHGQSAQLVVFAHYLQKSLVPHWKRLDIALARWMLFNLWFYSHDDAIESLDQQFKQQFCVECCTKLPTQWKQASDSTHKIESRNLVEVFSTHALLRQSSSLESYVESITVYIASLPWKLRCNGSSALACVQVTKNIETLRLSHCINQRHFDKN